jgi:N-acetylmuramoyl-L-alanine amidase
MTLAQHGVRISNILACVIFLTLFSLPSLQARQWDTPGASQAFEEAGQKRSQIAQTTQPTLKQYLECAKTYRRVHERDPHYRYTGDAIYQEGIIYQEMGDLFSNPEYYRTAAKRLQLLVDDYGGNQNCPDALGRLVAVYSKYLKNDIASRNAYQQLKTQYKYSKAAKQLTRPEISPAAVAPQTTAPSPTPSVSSTLGISTVQTVRYWSTRDYTRVIIDMDLEAAYKRERLRRPDRLYFDISNAKLSQDWLNKTLTIDDSYLSQIRISQKSPEVVRVVLDVSETSHYSVTELNNPFRIVIDLHGSEIKKTQSPSADLAAEKIVEPSRSKKKPVPSSASTIEPKIQEPPKAITNIESTLSKVAKPIASVASSDALKTQTAIEDSAAKKTTEPSAKSEPTKVISSTAGIDPKMKNAPLAVTEIASVSSKEASTTPTAASSGIANKIPGNLKTEPSTLRAPSTLNSSGPTSKSAPSTSYGDRTLTRMLGLKIGRIVLDPGHGGHDNGTVGPGGMLEKDLVLSLARELQKLLQQNLGAEVFLTRNDDTFISLEERTAMANELRADLFVSIHANSSRIRSISGVETYFLDFAKTDAEREIAARENSSSAKTISDLEDLIKKIAQADKSAESRELASIMQRKLFTGSQKLSSSTKNRGVRSAPFIVLIGANMPSVLAEVAFISNPKIERLLKKKSNQEAVAKLLFWGIEGYIDTLGSSIVHNQTSLNK